MQVVSPRISLRRLTILASSVDNVGDDCPVFDGLFDYCSISAGGSMGNTVSWGMMCQRSRVMQRVLPASVETNVI
jgi:hypothetical protein